jgi:hypothetical protein
MRVLRMIALCCLLTQISIAQRGGMGGGFRGGGMGGGFRGGFAGGTAQGRFFGGGGFRGGVGGFSGFRSGFIGNRFFSGNRFFFPNRFFFGNRFFFNRPFFGFRSVFGFPAFGFGLSYAPGFYDYPDYSYAAGASYPPAPTTTVVYPPQIQATPATPNVNRQPDESTSIASSPIYLIAFNDHVIRPAAAYWVDGGMLHYITLQREEKEAPLDTVDRGLTLQLNRERRVPFRLPEQ